jgi:exodeoxyribonuclease VII large subunit
MVDARLEEVRLLREHGRRTLSHALDRAGDQLEAQRHRARALSPLETLRRGYSVLQDAEGRVISSIDQTSPDDTVTIRVTDGRVLAVTTGVRPEESPDE